MVEGLGPGTDTFRLAIAKSRVPRMVAGDISATVVGVRAGGDALVRLVERHGLRAFSNVVARVYHHGEEFVRSFFAGVPDGRYVGEELVRVLCNQSSGEFGLPGNR